MAALVAADYEVFAINPLSVARYRKRHSTSGAKSDAADAHPLAEIVRLDRAHHRPVAGDMVSRGTRHVPGDSPWGGYDVSHTAVEPTRKVGTRKRLVYPMSRWNRHAQPFHMGERLVIDAARC